MRAVRNLALEHGKLVAQGQVLENEGLAAEECGPEKERDGRSEGHGAEG
jgi:hypothetical protein